MWYRFGTHLIQGFYASVARAYARSSRVIMVASRPSIVGDRIKWLAPRFKYIEANIEINQKKRRLSPDYNPYYIKYYFKAINITT